MAEFSMALPASLPLPSLATTAKAVAPVAAEGRLNTKMMLDRVSVLYNTFTAVAEVNLLIYVNKITAIIGPSGCGKSTLLRSLNRMNDLIPGARIRGTITLDEDDLYANHVDVVDIRRRVGMVFQRPNPFPKSIYDNVVYGHIAVCLNDKAIRTPHCSASRYIRECGSIIKNSYIRVCC